MSEKVTTVPSKSLLILQLLRALCHLVVVVTVTFWALLSWPMPWPGLLAAAGVLALVVVVWALFLSPKPMLHTDRFGSSLIELLFIGGAVAALLSLGTNWVFAALFGVVAAALGFFAGSGRTAN